MAVSFTADYLYQGTKIFYNPDTTGQTGCSEGLLKVGRGIYGVGVVVVAPVGVFYHITMAAWNALQMLCVEDSKELREKVWQHLDAALRDFVGFVSVAYGFIVVACVVTAFVLANPYMLIGCPGPHLLFRPCIALEEYYVPYIFAVKPQMTYSFFLPPTQHNTDIYSASLTIWQFARQGIAVDGPLSDQEIADWAAAFRQATSPQASPVDRQFLAPALLLKHNRVSPTARAHFEARVARRQEFEAAYQESLQRQDPAYYREKERAIISTLPSWR